MMTVSVSRVPLSKQTKIGQEEEESQRIIVIQGAKTRSEKYLYDKKRKK